jgi:hypothetical protein
MDKEEIGDDGKVTRGRAQKLPFADVREDAIMTRALGVGMKPVVQVGRDGDQGGGRPQNEHDAHQQFPAG